MCVSSGCCLSLYFGNSVVFVSYNCVTSCPETELFKIVSICCSFWVQGSSGWLHLSGSGLTNVDWIGSWVVIVWWSTGCWLDRMASWPWSIIFTTLSAKSGHKDSPSSKNSSSWRWNELKNPMAGGMDRDEWRPGNIFGVDHVGPFTKLIKSQWRSHWRHASHPQNH